jgi:hypothetical protein
LLLLAPVLAGLLVAGCIPAATSKAATDFGCAETGLTVEELGGLVQKVSGCGKTDIYGYLVMQDRWLSVTERASFELSCPRDQITLTSLAPSQVGVSGCDTKRVYVFSDAGWLLDSGSTESAEPRPMPVEHPVERTPAQPTIKSDAPGPVERTPAEPTIKP